ncbi:MAG: YwmB family TATA-box binding protein [Syntrophomonas sp.]
MKKTIIYITIFAIICFSSDCALKYSMGKEIENQSPYYLSFASIGANLLESRLDCWAKIKTTSNNEEMNQALLKVLNHLDLPAEQDKFLYQENNQITAVQYDLCNNDQKYYFMIQTNKTVNASHLLMTVIDKKSDKKLRQDEQRLKEILDCTVYYQYQGSINARPDYAGQEELLQIMLKNMDADIHDIYHDGKIISMTGYSPSIGRNIAPVTVGRKSCNVQTSIRRSDKENKTEVYLGFPLLLNDY